MTNAIANRIRQMPVIALLALAALLLLPAAAVATLTVGSVTSTVNLGNEEFVADPDVSVANKLLTKASANAAAAGDSSPGTDATIGLVEIREALTADNWVYQFEAKEAAIGSWGATRTYKVDVYADGVAQTALYFTNATADAANVEGVTVKVDLGGANLPDTLSIKITKVTN